MTVHILGAGPTGMAIVDELVQAGIEFALIERGKKLGGLAQTVDWPGIGRHDLGPHKLFTLDVALMARVEALLAPQDWLTRDKSSSIYMNGHYLPYPPSPFSLARVFGVPAFIGMTASYGAARLAGAFRRGEPRTFEEDIKARTGAGLYKVLFEPIARKLWGDPRNLDVKLSRGRVQTPSLIEVIARVLKLQKTSAFEALTFRYPAGGLDRLWRSIYDKTCSAGSYLMAHNVIGIDVEDDRCTAIRCTKDGTSVTLPVRPSDFVVSTLPLGLTTKLVGPHLSARVRDLSEQVIALNDLLLVFLHVDRPNLIDESWVFVPDPKIVFHRLSEQESFDPDMTPTGSIVCCEIMSNELRNMGAFSDAELIERAKTGLRDMGYIDHKVLNERVIRLPRSYPVFRPGFEPGLRDILAELDAIRNFRTVGRQGAFNYIGTLDAMDIGYGFARWLANGEGTSWSTERDRTSHYPVLD